MMSLLFTVRRNVIARVLIKFWSFENGWDGGIVGKQFGSGSIVECRLEVNERNGVRVDLV